MAPDGRHMSAPRATRAQLHPVVKGVLKADDTGPQLVLVRADPTSATEVGFVGDPPIPVKGSSSPLQIRAFLRGHGKGPLVVLTDAEHHALGEDLLARAAGRRVHRLDRWVTVCQMFGATHPSASLARRPHLADALIEAQPLAGYPKVTNRALDLETATAALVRASLGIADDVDDLAGFIAWASRPEAAGRLAGSGLVLDDLGPALLDRFGPGVVAVVRVVQAGHADDLVPLGLIAGVVETAGADGERTAVRLDERLDRARLDSAARAAWGAGAVALVRVTTDRARTSRWLERAEALLASYDANDLAHHSALLRSGFNQRIARAAAALTAWQGAPGDRPLADAAEAAIGSVEAHRDHDREPERAYRLRMAARLVRRGDLRLAPSPDLAALATNYQRDGAWLDAARVVVSRGDGDPTLDALCSRLAADADDARAEDGATVARHLADAAHQLPPSVVGVEEVLDRVVGPLADQRPVLVLVLDGLGLPTFCDLVDHIEAAGWAQYRPADRAEAPVGVAVLPTVTEVSRTSLLSGKLRRGDDGSERRAFADHPSLRAASRADAPPQLFHKRDLRAGGLDTRSNPVLDAIADSRRRVVGLVLNNVDERLKDVTQPVAGWDFDHLDPIRDVLAAARLGDRVVVLTADHGHVLDRGAEASEGGGGGDRWRPATRPAATGEVEVAGPRVQSPDGRAVLPWREQVRYGPRRNGYHGGLTPQEVFVPLAVLAVDDLDGWAPTTSRPPTWWHHAPLIVEPLATPATAAVEQRRPTPRSRPAADVPTLFDTAPTEPAGASPPADVPAAAAPNAPGWVDRVLASPQVDERRRSPRIRLRDDELRRLLAVLEAAGPMAIVQARLAQEAGLPPARVGRYVAQLQEVLNVDGYAVLTARDDEVRFDRALLERQIEL